MREKSHKMTSILQIQDLLRAFANKKIETCTPSKRHYEKRSRSAWISSSHAKLQYHRMGEKSIEDVVDRSYGAIKQITDSRR